MTKTPRDADMDEEMRDHVEQLTAQNLSEGMPPAEARRMALLKFGARDALQEGCRDGRGLRWLRELPQDLRYGARLLRKNPVFAVMVVLSLAIGIGANTAIFGLVNAVLLRPLPVADPAGLLLYSDGNRSGRWLGRQVDEQGRLEVFSYPLYQRLRAEDPAVDLTAVDSNAEPSVVRPGAGDGGRWQDDPTDRAFGRCVTANFFRVLGVNPQRGRTFLPSDETAPGQNPVLVLSDRYWRRRFRADPAVVGASLIVNGTSYTVVGVAPAGFHGAETGTADDFWIPVTMANEFTLLGLDLRNRSYWWLHIIGRLGAGATPAGASVAANVALHHFLLERPQDPKERAPHIRIEGGSTGSSPVREEFRQPLLALLAGVVLLLLIVCLNVSHLILARATGRQRELGIRASLGASRGRLLRQLFAEGLLTTGLGAMGAVLTARWFSAGLLTLAADGHFDLPLDLDVGVDGRVFAFLAATTLATALLLGIVPAWRISRADHHLHPRSAVAGGPSRRVIGRLLLISQVTFSLVLLVSAGLLAQSLGKLGAVKTGFDEGHLLLLELDLVKTSVSQPQAQQLYQTLLDRVEALPGVRAASLSAGSLLTGRPTLIWTIGFPGSAKPPQALQLYLVTPRYFETLGISLLRGRALGDADRADSARVVVINQTFARAAFGDANPLGQRLLLDNADRPVEVVGVVADTHNNDLRTPRRPLLYLPISQPNGIPAKLFADSLVVRTTGDPATLADTLRSTVRATNAGVPIMSVRTLEHQIGRTLVQDRLLTILASAFGLAALFLVALGLFGVISQWAARKTSEIGVHMALGATRARVRWSVMREAFALVGAGLLLGLPAALAAAHGLRSLLFGVSPLDPGAAAAATVALILIAALAAYLPARRAAAVDPMVALRHE
jgi:predicted permease